MDVLFLAVLFCFVTQEKCAKHSELCLSAGLCLCKTLVLAEHSLTRAASSEHSLLLPRLHSGEAGGNWTCEVRRPCIVWTPLHCAALLIKRPIKLACPFSSRPANWTERPHGARRPPLGGIGPRSSEELGAPLALGGGCSILAPLKRRKIVSLETVSGQFRPLPPPLLLPLGLPAWWTFSFLFFFPTD